jgi:cardiolipin synthase
MLSALITAAKNGVDVRITLPHIPDKWYVHTITRSNYDQLLQAGVRVYEYTPGFIHAKMMVADDEIAFVGTTNMDFRSYYMHFECGILFVGGSIIEQIKQDFQQTLLESIEVSEEDMKKVNVFVRISRAILNLFSALL